MSPLGVGISMTDTHLRHPFNRQQVDHTLKPIHEMQILSAPCNHPPSAMEVHKSWYEPFLQFWRLVKVELDLEGADMGVCDAFHLVFFVMGLN